MRPLRGSSKAPTPMSEPKLIKFNEGQQSGIEELSGGNALFVNCAVDATGKGIRARPGVMAWSEFPTNAMSTHPVVAMALLEGKIYYVTEDKASLTSPIRRVYLWGGQVTKDVVTVSNDTTTSCVAGVLK